jgi:type IV pilus assembly protein PilW
MKRQRGATIAELMVAAAVGLIAMLLAAGLLVSANAAYVGQVDAAAADDAGRYALEIITRAARQAAFVNLERAEAGADRSTAPASIGGLDARSLSRTTEGIDAPLADAANGSDVLALRYGGAADGSVISCAGFAVGEADDGWSIFYVDRNASGEAELRCKYRGKTNWGADAIVGGVDTFQVLYGLDTDSPADGLANEYVSAAVVDQRDATLVLAAADPAARLRELRRRTHWKRIASIRVALVVHGARRDRPDQQALALDLFGPAYSDAFGAIDQGVHLDEQTMPDDLRRRERRLFTSTVVLRNAPLEVLP